MNRRGRVMKIVLFERRYCSHIHVQKIFKTQYTMGTFYLYILKSFEPGKREEGGKRGLNVKRG